MKRSEADGFRTALLFYRIDLLPVIKLLQHPLEHDLLVRRVPCFRGSFATGILLKDDVGRESMSPGGTRSLCPGPGAQQTRLPYQGTNWADD
jgi:hypothetical protein